MSGLRILCLHGSGTSSDIWQIQSQALRNLLPSNWTYEWVNGEETCLPADGIEAIYPAPYFCYYNTPTLESMQEAHELVGEVIEEEGPFDAVLGFSQGAALAASIILHHQAENPFSLPLFQFAIFVNGSLPFSKSLKLGVDVTEMWVENRIDEGKVFTPTDEDTAPLKEWYEKGYTLETLPIRRFSPRTHKDLINIPTAHLYGVSDPFRAQSLRLMEICDKKQLSSFEHNGGHNVPRETDQGKQMAQVIMRTFQKAAIVVA